MSVYRKFQSLHFFRYLGDALFYAFLTLFFSSLNFPPWQLGTLLASMPLMAIAGSLVLGKLSGNTSRNITILKITNIIEGVFMLFFGFISNFWILLLFTVIVSFSNKSFYSLLDSISMDVSKACNKNYSNIRIFGSLAYLISSFAGGYLIDWINFSYVFMIAGILFLLSGIIMFFTKFNNDSNETIKDSVTLKELFTNKKFIFYLLFYILALGASNVSDNMFALYTDSLGITQSNYGMIFSLMIAFEIVTIFIVTKFAKEKSWPILLVISGAIILLRNVFLAVPLPLYAVMAIGSVRGIAWGMMLATHMNYLNKIVSSKHLTKAVFILNIFLQIYNTIFNQFGPMINQVSYSLTFGILATCGLLGSIFMFISFKCNNTKEIASNNLNTSN